jgi:hypothetical protein
LNFILTSPVVDNRKVVADAEGGTNWPGGMAQFRTWASSGMKRMIHTRQDSAPDASFQTVRL